MKSTKSVINSTNLFTIIFCLGVLGLGMALFKEITGTQKIVLAILAGAVVISETIKKVAGGNGLFPVNKNVVNLFTAIAYVVIFYVGCCISSSKDSSADMIVLAIIGACMVIAEQIIAPEENKKTAPLNLSQPNFGPPFVRGVKKA